LQAAAYACVTVETRCAGRSQKQGRAYLVSINETSALDESRSRDGDALELPSNCTALELFQALYRNAKFPVTTRMRAARDAIPYESPRLQAIAVIEENSFAAKLEQRRLRRIQQMKLIEEGTKFKVIEPKVIDHSLPPPITDRRFRRRF
jgi:hypothetical protein